MPSLNLTWHSFVPFPHVLTPLPREKRLAPPSVLPFLRTLQRVLRSPLSQFFKLWSLPVLWLLSGLEPLSLPVLGWLSVDHHQMRGCSPIQEWSLRFRVGAWLPWAASLNCCVIPLKNFTCFSWRFLTPAISRRLNFSGQFQLMTFPQMWQNYVISSAFSFLGPFHVLPPVHWKYQPMTSYKLLVFIVKV